MLEKTNQGETPKHQKTLVSKQQNKVPIGLEITTTQSIYEAQKSSGAGKWEDAL